MEKTIPAILIIVLFMFIVIMLINKSNRSKMGKSKRAPGYSPGSRSLSLTAWPSEEPPSALGVPYRHPARPAAERLEAALTNDFESRIKDRVLKQLPSLSDKEWKWTFFELKRFFLMCGLLRGVPMYSGRADLIWHEMLMFTREYEQFCNAFCGGLIHHAPHSADERLQPDDRSWFDWVYGELFQQTPASGRVWGAFFKTPLPRARADELLQQSEQALKEKWFNVKAADAYSDMEEAMDYLLWRLKSQLNNNDEQVAPYPASASSSWKGGYDPVIGATGMLSGMLIFYSLSASTPDVFAEQMNAAQTKAQREANGSGSSTYGCDGGSFSNDRHEPSGSHDSGDSSSSCGSGDSGGGGCGGGCSS
ncbi:hypothetical protein SAMN04487969_115137 [Paenibacillus algorifonticola]|uniref:Uncharacterized protein n=1 Tax=Paenibacillus algorifonticola TaxID=684063 RepID=A0A1I2GED2_9BACL|nr:hypothetical protein [Paenibacillus algorifonticola]SFF15267.1 hypothetical protein SAMN04487969_115137 [Paenibacillus algorifonticola]